MTDDPIPELVAAAEYPFRVLPPGIHRCDENAMRERFVEQFPGSKTRAEIFRGFVRWRRVLSSMGVSGTQWVDGSFVEGKADPADVDVLTIVDRRSLDSISLDGRAAAETHLSEHVSMRAIYRVDAYMLVDRSDADPEFGTFREIRERWASFWSRVRDVDAVTGAPFVHVRKGFLALTLSGTEGGER